MLPNRFWGKVRRGTGDQCWVWVATTCGGYGHFRDGQKVRKAHRLVYEDIHGPIPDGMVVMHRCDNRRCVNPSHLTIGKPRDNNRDRDAKGRQVAKRGEAHGMSRLKELQVHEIKSLAADVNEKIAALAAKFGVSETTVRDVFSGKTWRWYLD